MKNFVIALSIVAVAVAVGITLNWVGLGVYTNYPEAHAEDEVELAINAVDNVNAVDKSTAALPVVAQTSASVPASADKSIVIAKADDSVPLKAFRVIGLRDSIDLSSTQKTVERLHALWKKFENLDALHAIVDWRTSNPIYVVYDQLDSEKNTARVTLGYPQHRLLNKQALYAEVDVQAGQYQVKDLAKADTRTVNMAWFEWLAEQTPSTVIERYMLDVQGDLINVKVYKR